MNKRHETVSEMDLMDITRLLMLKDQSKIKEADVTYNEDGSIRVVMKFRRNRKRYKAYTNLTAEDMDLTPNELYARLWNFCKENGQEKYGSKEAQRRKLAKMKENGEI